MYTDKFRKLIRKALPLAMAALLLTLSLSACGFGRESAASGSTGGIMMSGARNVAGEELAVYDMEAELTSSDSGSLVSSDSGSLISSDRKLVKTYYISLETTEFDDTVELIKSRAEEFGGYIENSSVSGTSIRYESSSSRYAYIVARIPTDRVDEYLNEAQDAGNVLQKQEEIEDITLQYTDTESYLSALTLEQSRLMELIGEAESVEDLIALNTRLTEVERLIESQTRQIRLYDSQIDYTSVSFDISEVKVYTPVAEEGIIEQMKRGLSDNIEALRNVGVGSLVWVVSHLPSIVLILVIVLAAAIAARRAHLVHRAGERLRGLRQSKRGRTRRDAEDN